MTHLIHGFSTSAVRPYTSKNNLKVVTVGEKTARVNAHRLNFLSEKFSRMLAAKRRWPFHFDVPADLTAPFFAYLRRGAIEINGDNVASLLQIANEHLMDHLANLCVSYLAEHIKNADENSLKTILEISCLFEKDSLTFMCLQALKLPPDDQMLKAVNPLILSLFEASSGFRTSTTGTLIIEAGAHLSEKMLESLDYLNRRTNFELVVRDDQMTVDDTILLLNRFTRLKGFGNEGKFLRNSTDLKCYLSLFNDCKLRALNLTGMIWCSDTGHFFRDLSDEDIELAKRYFPELYSIIIKSDKITEIDVPKADKVEVSGSCMLTSLKAPSARTISTQSCDALVTLDVANAEHVSLVQCNALQTVNADRADKVFAYFCGELQTLHALNAHNVSLTFCSAIKTLYATDTADIRNICSGVFKIVSNTKIP